MTEHKFPKSDRVLKRDGFRRVYEQGRKVQSRLFTAFLIANQAGNPRIGITVTRKIGNSVKRNRARRLLREAFRKNKWLAQTGVDIVINVKRALTEAGYREVEDELVALLKRAGEK